MNARQHHGFILVTSVVPLLGTAAAVVLLWRDLVGPSDLAAFGVMYVLAGLGISVGYHRLLTHRSFETARPVRLVLAACGAMAGQAPPIVWVAHHRRHHSHADRPGDPHSPYGDGEPGLRGALRGLWHAHLGWLLAPELTSDPLRWCPDVARDPDMRFVSRYFVGFVALGVTLPAAIGLTLTGTLAGALGGALWGGLVRLFVGNHVTYSVNSVGHYFGSRRFATKDESRNVAWLALPSFGEAWHNNHHAFPRSARHGLRWYELDVSAGAIALLRRLGLARNVVTVDRSVQESRAGGSPGTRFRRGGPPAGARRPEPGVALGAGAGED